MQRQDCALVRAWHTGCAREPDPRTHIYRQLTRLGRRLTATSIVLRSVRSEDAMDRSTTIRTMTLAQAMSEAPSET
jgi:hypothetical protein